MSTSATIRGLQILKWGTYTASGFIVTDEDLNNQTESFQIEDENGDVATDVTAFGLKQDITFSFIPLTGATQPSPGAVLTGGPNGVAMIVRNCQVTRSRKNAETWRITGVIYPNIALS